MCIFSAAGLDKRDFMCYNAINSISKSVDGNKVVFGKPFREPLGGAKRQDTEDELPLGSAVRKRLRVVPHG